MRTAYIAVTALAFAAPLAAQVQIQQVFTACYVPSTGTVYRIDKPAGTAPGSPTACGVNRKGVPDVEFTWRDGVSAHSQLSGLTSDDHPQYLLTDGARQTLNGFAVKGEVGQGAIPAVGVGARLMWYPRKAAIRAGLAQSTEWNDASIGIGSTALGSGVLASGARATALGNGSEASGDDSFAAGDRATAAGQGAVALGATTASGNGSFAVGNTSVASATAAIAIGAWVGANAPYATALGAFAQADHQGSFVYGDRSITTNVRSNADNQFKIRAAGGVQLRTSADQLTGCDLPAGSGVWQCTSSKSLKTAFTPLAGETVLAKLRGVPVTAWSYTAERGVRHIGPFAEDFHKAFGVGTDSTSIGMIDAAGVSLAGVKALDARTRRLEQRIRELERMLAPK